MSPTTQGRAASTARWAWRGFVLTLLVALGITVWDYAGRWHTPGLYARNLIMHTLYWAPRWAGGFLLLGLLSHAVAKRGGQRWRAALLSVGVLIGLWSSWVEPHWVRVRETTLRGIPASAQPVRIALIADIHWGLFYRSWQLRDLVQRLNGLDVDAVLVAGDWTHEPPLDLLAELKPLADIRHPVFGVLGNHDVQAPGPPLTAPLRAALQAHGVQLIEGRSVDLLGWTLIGLDDQWGGLPQPQVAQLWPNQNAVAAVSNRLVLAHQPDTLALLPPGGAFLGMAGHTHGGQIWLPGITPWWLKNTNSEQPWWNGLYAAPSGHIMVTPGLGTIGLPARLAVRPTIDVISLAR